jgi:hypothetical protein
MLVLLEWLSVFVLELLLALTWLALLAVWLVWMSKSAQVQLSSSELASLRRLAQERKSLREKELALASTMELDLVPRRRFGTEQALLLILSLVLSLGWVWLLGTILPLVPALIGMVLWALGMMWVLVRLLGRRPEKK